MNIRIKLNRLLAVVLVLFLTLPLFACFKSVKNDVKIVKSSNFYELRIGEELNLPIQINDMDVTYSSSKDIVSIEGSTLKALKRGKTVIYARSNDTILKEYVVQVTGEEVVFDLVGSSYIPLSTSSNFFALKDGEKVDVFWESSDEKVLTIDQDGVALAVGEGLAQVSATPISDPDSKKTMVVLVIKEENVDGENNTINTTLNLSNSLLESILYPLIDDAKSYTIGVKRYDKDRFGNRSLTGSYCGFVYKRFYVLDSGETVSEIDENSKVVKYKYFALTNRHVVKGASELIVYDPECGLETSCEVVQYDLKVDIAIISFETQIYYKEAKFANSDDIKSGEFIITLDAPMGSYYANTASIGIISSTNRYLSDDTDGDGTNDWDARYIQHDASINEGSDGSPIINLKGEVLGMNTMKISSVKTEDMGFAIPINTIEELLEFLERGEQVVRPVLGVTAIEVKTIIVSKYYQSQYPIDEGITFGIYIVEVNEGVAKIAGVQPKDILVQINGVNIYYTYILRAELGKFAIGSGDECEIVVYRNGEYITLKVVF